MPDGGPTSNQVIVGVHGLSRKPPEPQLTDDWLRSLREGLGRNDGLDVAPERLGLELVYWADWLQAQPYGPGEDPEPYTPAPGTEALPGYKNRWFDQVLVDVLDRVTDPLDWGGALEPLDALKRYVGLDEVATRLLQKRLVDLGTYYLDQDKRAQLRGRLAQKLMAHRGKRVMLIAHSMGSIIAYDVLRDLGRELTGMQVDHLVTIGSPLGMPYVLYKIRQENASIRTPSIVRRWTNLADRRDPVAVDVHLADEFEPNDRGVSVEDRLVINGYVAPSGKPNHHKIYGYLRTPELSQLVKGFI